MLSEDCNFSTISIVERLPHSGNTMTIQAVRELKSNKAFWLKVLDPCLPRFRREMGETLSQAVDQALRGAEMGRSAAFMDNMLESVDSILQDVQEDLGILV